MPDIKRKFPSFFSTDPRAVSMVEYGVVAALVVVVAFTGLATVGGASSADYAAQVEHVAPR